jgi:hypothetical protein
MAYYKSTREPHFILRNFQNFNIGVEGSIIDAITAVVRDRANLDMFRVSLWVRSHVSILLNSSNVDC